MKAESKVMKFTVFEKAKETFSQSLQNPVRS